MKYTKYIVQSIIGLFLSFGIMCYRGLFQTETAADRVMLVCDGFSAVALLYMAVGGLLYGTLLTLVVVPCIYDLLNRKKDMTEEEI